MLLDGIWYTLEAKEMLKSSDPVKGLDVSLLQDGLLAPVLGIMDPRTDHRIAFIGGIRGTQELERRCALDMRAAFSLFPTSMEELLAVADLQVANAETDPDTVDLLLDIISAKPMIIAIAVLVSLVTGIVWYCSVVRTVNTFCRDTADIIPVRYRAEFAAVPEKYRPAVLARMVYSLCFALVFCADISFDNVRFLPLSAFFLNLSFKVLFPGLKAANCFCISPIIR